MGNTLPSLNPENIHLYLPHLSSYLPLDLADQMEKLSSEERNLIFTELPPDLATLTFEYLPAKIQKELINSLPSSLVATILNNLSPDDRTAFLEELPAEVINYLIKILSPEERVTTLKLLGYPEGSVGRLMTPDYISIKLDWTIGQVLENIRLHGKDSETINVIYAVDDNNILVDDFKIRDFLLNSPEKKVKEIADGKFLSLSPYEKQEQAVNLFKKTNRVALPVVDQRGVLLGLVTIDDILNIAEEESTEDIQMIGGTMALDVPYMSTPFLDLMQKRAGWLVILFLGEMLTATALGYFEAEIARAAVLALFLPLIISSGGNAGSQASTLVIRALALGEVTLKDYWRIMKREIVSGLFLGFLLGSIGFLRVALWSSFSTIYGPHWPLIALTIFFSLIGVVLWGTVVGSMLPIILKRCGSDPAVSSNPFIATIVDVTGLIIYFNIALFLLKGSLL
jgi:magnesium transporter